MEVTKSRIVNSDERTLLIGLLLRLNRPENICLIVVSMYVLNVFFRTDTVCVSERRLRMSYQGNCQNLLRPLHMVVAWIRVYVKLIQFHTICNFPGI